MAMRLQLKLVLSFGMVAQIIIAAVGDAFKLLHAVRKLIFYIITSFGIMRQIFFRRGVNVHMFTHQTLFFPPFNPFFFPKLVPFFILPRQHKIFKLGLFKLAYPKNKIARRNFVTKRLTDLRNPERQLA